MAPARRYHQLRATLPGLLTTGCIKTRRPPRRPGEASESDSSRASSRSHSPDFNVRSRRNGRAARARHVRIASRRRRRERSVTNRPTSPPRRYGWQVRVRSQTHTRHEHRQSSTSTRLPAGLLTRTTTLADYVPRPTTTAADNVRGRNRPTPVRLSRRESEERARLARIAAVNVNVNNVR